MSNAIDPDATGTPAPPAPTTRQRPGPKPGSVRTARALDPDDEYAGPTDNGRLKPCTVVGCRGHGTHWRRDERRPVAQSVLVCIDHQVQGALPPIPPPELDEVGDRLEAMVHAALDGIRPGVAAAKLHVPIGEVQRIARVRGLPLVGGLLRPRPGAALPAIRLEVEEAPPPRRVVEMPDVLDTDDLLDDDTDDDGPIPDPIDASEDARELAAEAVGAPRPVTPRPEVTKRDPPADAMAHARAKLAADPDEPKRFQAAVLAVFADGAWKTRAQVAATGLALGRLTRTLVKLSRRGHLESRGPMSRRQYRVPPPIAPALALAARHPPPQRPGPRGPDVSSSDRGRGRRGAGRSGGPLG